MKAGKKFFNEIWIELTVDQRIYLTEYINKQKQDYARIQIKKDREEITKKLLKSKVDIFTIQSLARIPINLD